MACGPKHCQVLTYMSTKLSRLTFFKLPACATVFGTKLHKKRYKLVSQKQFLPPEDEADTEIVPTVDKWEVCNKVTDSEIVVDVMNK